VEVKIDWNYTSALHYYLHGMYKEIFKFSLYLINKYIVNVYGHDFYVMTNCQHFRCFLSSRFMVE